MKGMLLAFILCSAVSAQDTPAPCPLPEDLRSERFVYARHGTSELALQVYVRGNGNDASQAVVILPDPFSQTWRDCSCYAIGLAQKGFVVAVADYRTPKTALYPAAIEDAVAAASWLRKHGDEHGLRVNPVGLLGFGFGGYVAALAGLRSPDVMAVVTVDAVADLSTHGYPIDGDYPYGYHAFLGVSRAEDPGAWKEASPVTHVTVNAPSFALVRFEEGGRTPERQMDALSIRLREENVWVRTSTFPSPDDLLPGGSSFEVFMGRLERVFADRLEAPDKALSLTRNVVYRTTAGKDLHLDILRDPSAKGRRPAVLWFHGGGYVWGSKRDRANLTEALAKDGYTIFSVEYTRASYRKAPAMMHDAHAAVAWVRDHADEYGVDPDRIGAVGESAGAHLSSLLGIESQFGLAEDSPADVQAVVSISGIVDVPRLAGQDWYTPGILLGVPLGQDEELWRYYSPAFRAHEQAAPFLALHGTRDVLGTIEEMKLYTQDLRSYGISAEVLILEEGQHNFWNYPQWREPALQKMKAFLREQLGPR